MIRRISKKFLILLVGLLFITLYCEFIIYYVVVAQCTWPKLNNSDSTEPLRAFILADTHLLGPYRGHWLDKWRREWQMKQAFQAVIALHKPDVVFVLGDLFDEGEWTSEKQFIEYVERFNRLFSIPPSTKMYVAVGNHDIGFHNRIRRGAVERFEKMLNAPSVQFLTLKGNHFILINSMAMEGDYCRLCVNARNAIDKIADNLKSCAKDHGTCYIQGEKVNYSQPILMQHFPLYRVSDAKCTEPDAPPLPDRNKLFRLKIDAISKESTEYLVEKVKPRAVFGGHTHHGCLVHHKYKRFGGVEFLEYSVPSFSWRNRPDPKYMLASITPNEYQVNKCGLPLETTIVLTAVIMTLILIGYVASLRIIGRTR